MYRYFVFDVDGTLLDTEKICLTALQRLIRSRQGREVALEDCRFSLGVPSGRVLTMLGLEATSDLMDEWNGYYDEMLPHARAFDGISELLEALFRRGIPMGVITSRTRGEVETDAGLRKLSDYFEVMVTADDTAEHKPSPAPMLHYLHQTGALPGETLYIGDTAHDWACAHGAGVDFALAGWSVADPSGIAARYIPPTPGELLALAASPEE